MKKLSILAMSLVILVSMSFRLNAWPIKIPSEPIPETKIPIPKEEPVVFQKFASDQIHIYKGLSPISPNMRTLVLRITNNGDIYVRGKILGQKGDKGDKGEQGIQGVKGDKGEQGIPGNKGDKGDNASIWCSSADGNSCGCGSSLLIRREESRADGVTSVSVALSNGTKCTGSSVQKGVYPNALYYSGSACLCEVR